MPALQDHIQLINRELHDKYDQICDESSRRRFEYLLNDIDYDIEEFKRREVREG